jgi:3-isopropylmalate/(R)-2-methylmalate dehydratase small subunit
MSRVFTFGDDIDTDQIIPARWMVTHDPAELAKHCMEDADPTFIERMQPGDFIVAGKNFGCGSSREHAPVSIKGAGVQAVIARTFARIFYRNAINVGLPILECPEAVDDIDEGDELDVDLAAGVITNRTKGRTYQAQGFPDNLREIMAAGGMIEYLKAKLNPAG